MRRQKEKRPLQKYKPQNQTVWKKEAYTITILTPENEKAYLQRLPNGNFLVIATIKGATIWDTHAAAVLINEIELDGGGTVECVDLSHLQQIRKATKEINVIVTPKKMS